MERGPVDVMIERWERERPDLDASSLQIIARLTRLARAIDEDAAAALREFNLSNVEFQLLAAIRTAPDEALSWVARGISRSEQAKDDLAADD